MINQITLTETMLNEQYETIVKFLKSVHPFLDKPKQHTCIELRPISRNGLNFYLSKSCNLWNLNELSLNKLKDFLKIHNGEPYCLYYSVYSFDYHKDSYTKEGKLAKKEKITSSKAVFTQEIALDFDKIDESKYKEMVDIFESIDLYPLWTHTGHGYQAHILLDRPLMDKQALHKIVYLFRSKGFDADPTCIDAARLMRLPYTYNCKCFNGKDYVEEVDNPPLCELLQETNERYSFEDIETKLNKLKTVRKEEVAEQSKIKLPKAKKETEDDILLTKTVYPWLDKFDIPESICKILANTPSGLRNLAFGFLVRYLKSLKLSKTQIYTILDTWSSSACHPAMDEQEFNSDFERFYYRNGLGYSKALAEKFGYFDFGAENIRLKKENIFLPADFINKLDELDAKSVRLYLAVKMLEHVEKETTRENIAKQLGLSMQAIQSTINDLIKNKFIYIVEGNRKLGIPNQYVASKIVSSMTNGYLTISYNDAKAYINELSNSELKLYLFLLHKCFSGEGHISQLNLGKFIGKSRSRVNELMKELNEKDFIRMEKVPINDKFYYWRYRLLR